MMPQITTAELEALFGPTMPLQAAALIGDAEHFTFERLFKIARDRNHGKGLSQAQSLAENIAKGWEQSQDNETSMLNGATAAGQIVKEIERARLL